MRMQPAISVRGLSKLYRLGAADGGGYRTLRESIMGGLTTPMRRLKRMLSREPDGEAARAGADSGELWALKDVSFEIEPGEVIGIVGRNGAGKSTLLKILCRITHPTHGSAELHGRVGSLLEVGTGFHPELTGRENVYLNGAILGMSRREIDRRFDDIVAFAEVDRFLDTPVKRYSSGMYTRLAFAVASHLEPEILIVDEVLAVGDAQFQKKCLGRMNEVSRQGRTVIFVSHNMGAVKALCTRGILVEAGRVTYQGNIDETVNRYMDAGCDAARTGIVPDDAQRICDTPGEARIRTVRVTTAGGLDINQLYFGQPFRVGMTCSVFKDIEDAHFEISISTLDGIQVTYSATTDGGVEPLRIPAGEHEIWADFDMVLLPRQYTIDVGVHHDRNGATADFVQRTFDFTVLGVAESGADHYRWPRTRGLVRAPARWQVRRCPGAAEEAGD